MMETMSTSNLSDVRMCTLQMKDNSYKEFYEIAQTVTGLAIFPIFCIMGIVGNALTIYVMSSKNLLSSTNAFLSALAVSDSIKLINDVMYIFVTILLRKDPVLGSIAYGYLYPYAHFVFSMSVSVSSWLTVSVALERYILVCHPARARAFWNRKRAVVLCVSIYIIMTILALPSAFRYRTARCVNMNTGLLKVEVELTEIWQNQPLVTAYEWFQNLLRSTIPLIVLVVLNACIISALRRNKMKRRRNPRHRVTVMMIVVILVFLICITPDAILSTVFGFGYHEAGYLGKGIREITDSLLAVNAGVNFIIYCVFNQVFRKRFARICCVSNRRSGWITELDEANYRRLCEAKCLLSTNNNIPTGQIPLVFGDKTNKGSQEILCQDKRASIITLDNQNSEVRCSLVNNDQEEIKQESSPLISSSPSFSTDTKRLHYQQSYYRVSSSGLKKSRNSVKSNRFHKNINFSCSDNSNYGKKSLDKDHQEPRVAQEPDLSHTRSSWSDSTGLGSESTESHRVPSKLSSFEDNLQLGGNEYEDYQVTELPATINESSSFSSDDLWNFRISNASHLFSETGIRPDVGTNSNMLNNNSNVLDIDTNVCQNTDKNVFLDDIRPSKVCYKSKDKLKSGKKKHNLSVSFLDNVVTDGEADIPLNDRGRTEPPTSFRETTVTRDAVDVHDEEVQAQIQTIVIFDDEDLSLSCFHDEILTTDL